MKVLLDESVPKRLALFFPDPFDVYTVQRMGWAGRSNGDLLRLAAGHGFGALVTVDQGIEHQQSAGSLQVPVVIMIAVRTRLRELEPLVPRVVAVLSADPQGQVYHVRA